MINNFTFVGLEGVRTDDPREIKDRSEEFNTEHFGKEIQCIFCNLQMTHYFCALVESLVCSYPIIYQSLMDQVKLR